MPCKALAPYAPSAPLAFALMLVATLLALVAPGLVQAESLYKCTDTDGNQFYLNKPCPIGTTGKKLYSTEPPASPTGPSTDDTNPYSIVNQARMLERKKESARRAALLESVQSSPDYPTAIRNIDSALAQLSADARILKPQATGQSVAARWALEDLQAIQAQAEQLLQTRDNVMARWRQADAANARAQAAATEATARDALAQAQNAQAQAEAAKAQAQAAERRARAAESAAKNRQIDCQIHGNHVNCD